MFFHDISTMVLKVMSKCVGPDVKLLSVQGHAAFITYRAQRSYGYEWDIEADHFDVPASKTMLHGYQQMFGCSSLVFASEKLLLPTPDT